MCHTASLRAHRNQGTGRVIQQHFASSCPGQAAASEGSLYLSPGKLHGNCAFALPFSFGLPVGNTCCQAWRSAGPGMNLLDIPCRLWWSIADTHHTTAMTSDHAARWDVHYLSGELTTVLQQ